jgi:uncharacterized membrane protein
VGHAYLLSGGTFTTVDFPGATSSYARAINDSGQIAGGYYDAGFIATPTPEPNTMILSAGIFGLVAVQVWRRRRYRGR